MNLTIHTAGLLAAAACLASATTGARAAGAPQPLANGVMEFPHTRVVRQPPGEAAPVQLQSRQGAGAGMTAYRDPATRQPTGPNATQAASLIPPRAPQALTFAQPVIARSAHGGISAMLPDRYDRYAHPATVCRDAAGKLMERCDHEK